MCKTNRKYFDNYDFFKTRNSKMETILHYSAQEGLKNVLQVTISYLKKNKKDYLEILNLPDEKNWNCLFSAIESTDSGLPEIVELLIRNGVDVNFKDKFQVTPLHLACYKGQDDNVDLLISSLSDLNAKDSLGSKNDLIFFYFYLTQEHLLIIVLWKGKQMLYKLY